MLTPAQIYRSIAAGGRIAPTGILPVKGFELARYLGTWHEIARIDTFFERGLTRVQAEYSLRNDGSVKVLNRGYSEKKGVWKTAVGRAYFAQTPDVGHLRVSFFGPFFGAYVIFDLDKTDYAWSMVCGPNRDFLWILSRTPSLDPSTMEHLMNKAACLGFDTSRLVYS